MVKTAQNTLVKVDGMMNYLTMFWRREPWMAEFWSATVSILLALVVLRVPHEWHAMSRLELVAGTTVWQAMAFGLGVFQLCSLFVDNRIARWLCSCLCAAFYGTLCAGIWQSMGGVSVACIFALGYVGINVFSGIRLTRPHG